MDAATRSLLPLQRAVELTSAAPAERFSLSKKGKVAIGCDADIVLFDPHEEWAFAHDRLASRSAASAAVYDGFSLRGRVVTTIVGGRIVFERGRIVGEPAGKFVRPTGSSIPAATAAG
jgi:dihydroorotase-like cyclic amidohydrolase